MENMEDQRNRLGTKPKSSQCSPLGHHVTFGARKGRVQIQHVLDIGFGLEDRTKLYRLPRLHTDSNWGVLGLHEKLIKSTFIWIQTHVHIFSEGF
jgi:hypothetical protein